MRLGLMPRHQKASSVSRGNMLSAVMVPPALSERRCSARETSPAGRGTSRLLRPMYVSSGKPNTLLTSQVKYPFEKLGYEDVQFIIDPVHWHMVARLTKEKDGSGWWRVSYGEIGGLTREELIARQPMKYEAMLPGHPKPGEYELAAVNPYKIHQRLVEKLRIGRFCLAADAAHCKCGRSQ